MAFEPLRDIANKFAKINLNQIAYKVWQRPDVQERIVNFIRWDQLFNEGIDGNGEPLINRETGGDEYTDFTYMMKLAQFGSFPRHYTLFDTSEFYESMMVIPENDGFETISDPMKPDGTNLLEKFGTEILNLTEENKQKLIEFIKPYIFEEIRLQIL